MVLTFLIFLQGKILKKENEKYCLDKRLATGMFGCIYKGRFLEKNKTLAVKAQENCDSAVSMFVIGNNY